MNPEARRGTVEGGSRTVGRQYLPLGIDVCGLECLVVGGGRIGTRKALTLSRAGARVTVLSPEISPRLAGAAARGEISWRRGAYDPEALRDRALVVAATDDPRLNLAVREDCERLGVLSCVVSPGRASRVVFPAVHRADGLTVAVHSDGRDCAASRRARDRIAEVMRAPRTGRARLCVLGLERGRVPEEFFAELDRAAGRLRGVLLTGRDFSEAMILSTCRRWECWFLAASPAAGARELRGLIHERSGLLLEEEMAGFRLESGPAASLRLLEVACGLRSSLPGETEIVGQLRDARDRFLPESSSPLRRTVDHVLHLQRRIRRDAGLVPVGGGWVARTLSQVTAGRSGRATPRVVVLGMGGLGTKLRDRLAREGLKVSAVSRRVAQDVEGVHPSERLEELLDAADVAVVTSAGEEEREKLSRRRRAGLLRVVDLSSASGLGRIGRPELSGADADGIAAARALAFEHALKPAPNCLGGSRLRLGARGSRLSRVQVGEALRFIGQVAPAAEFEVVAMDTPGDRDRSTPLPAVAAEDFFTRDLDRALLEGRIDLAAHSAKDLPSSVPDGLVVAALLPSFAPWECLVAKNGRTLAELPPGAVVGTSSARRREWLLARRPDLVPREVRGNVHGRVEQLDAGEFDALILAAAGLIRLNLAGRITQVFDLEDFAPPAGQGSLALLVRAGDGRLRRALGPLDLGDRRGLP
ncbi:MAG: hydroxymethylbilane synthase, partial [Planctomycetota bacterium]